MLQSGELGPGVLIFQDEEPDRSRRDSWNPSPPTVTSTGKRI
jgi:hypothetical protein